MDIDSFLIKNEKKINGIVNSLGEYELNQISLDSINQFLRQINTIIQDPYECTQVLNGTINILKNIEFYGKATMIKNIELLMDRIDSIVLSNVNYCVLGNSQDSSARLYSLLEKEKINFYTDLSCAINNTENNNLAFLDDGMYSGRQIISIFQEWMNVSKENIVLNEHHVNPIPENEVEKLKDKHIIIGFINCYTPSIEYVYKELNKLGIRNIDIIFNNCLDQKTFTTGSIFSSIEEKRITEWWLKYIGERILLSKRSSKTKTFYGYDWSKNKVKNASLGYNNAQQKVVFYYNTPTYTITPLWCSGTVDNTYWRALFKRNSK